MSEPPKYIPKPPPPDEINNSDLGSLDTFKKGILILTLVIFTLLSVAKFIPGVLVSLTPESVELKIGTLLSKHPMLKGGEESEKLNKIIEKFSSSKDFPKIKEIRLKETNMENAFATIDKRIVVTKPLLDKSKSEIALAFVIAHEIGHIKHRHPLKGLYGSFIIQSLMAFLGGNDSVMSLSGKLVTSSFSRDQESEADLYGLNLVHQTYGSIKGAFDFFERNKSMDKLVKLTTGSLLSTHPLSQKRIDTLKKYALKNNWDLALSNKKENSIN